MTRLTATQAIAVGVALCTGSDDDREPWPPYSVEQRAEAAKTLAALSFVLSKMDHIGYEPDLDCAEHGHRVIDWYCMGSNCGQPCGKPHLDDCPVAPLYAAALGLDPAPHGGET